MTQRRWLFSLTLVCGLAFALRIYRLDAVPLRGDEAFSIAYWAAPPGDVVADLAHTEPHPFGAFFGFWAWKQVAGESAFAMRYLPALGNTLGAAALAVLARRLFHDHRLGLMAAGLWAINPFLIWHAQDVRNYALWAALSPLAMWLFLRATASNRPRDWLLYLLAEVAALYLFFLESLLLVVQAVYLLLFPPRQAIRRRVLFTWAMLGLALIPWFIQLAWLADSGYTGTREHADPARLLSWFLPTLLTGNDLGGRWPGIAPLAWCVLLGIALGLQPPGSRRRLVWLLAWIIVPVIALLLIAGRMRVFDPRYLIAVLPALILLEVRALAPSAPQQGVDRRVQVLFQAAIVIPVLLGFGNLAAFYRGDDPKAPNWSALVGYLDTRARPGDLIVQVSPDPAFTYYYRGPVAEGSLRPDQTAAEQLGPELDRWHAFWLIGRSPDAENFLSDHLQTLNVHSFDQFSVIQYLPVSVSPDEIVTPSDVTFGTVARLAGYTVQGPDPAVQMITVLLYWEPLARTQVDYKVFVHLVGPTNPATGSPLWDQEDHTPLFGTFSTRTWPLDSLLRDPYHVLDDPVLALIPGEYTVQIGLYDPATTERLPVIDADGAPLGDSIQVIHFMWPLDS